MNYQDKIISGLANSKCEAISRKVIRALIKMTDGMQSGDGTPLKNIWDEICIQVQEEHSVMWDSYLNTVQSLILGAVAELDATTKQAIWLQTDEGMDWEVAYQEGQKVPIVEEDIGQYILNNFVLPAAADWTNKRIEEYILKERY
jgi:hypothetical protein